MKINIVVPKYTLFDNSTGDFSKIDSSNHLYKLLITAYGLNHFSINNHLFFTFEPDWFDSSVRAPMYDSFFYTFVSMVLTRSERDKFIKLFRKEY